MKYRKMITAGAVLLSSFLAASCCFISADEENTVVIENEYVQAGQYEGVKVARVEGLPTITDTAVDNNISLILKGFSERNDVSRPAEEGDAVTVDYTVTVDGEDYPEGSAAGYTTIIGDNTVFKGFDTSAIGHSAGDSWDIEHTYSDTYGIPALAGKTAVFHVTLNNVQEVRLPSLTDDFVQKVSRKSSTVEEYREEIRQILEDNNRDYLMKEIRDKVWQTVLATSEVKQYPEDLVLEEKNSFYDYYQRGADFYEMSFDEFLDRLDISKEHFEEEAVSAAESNVRENLVAELIAETVGLDLTAESLEEEKKLLADSLGFDSVEELVKDAPNEAYVNRMAVREMVMDWVADHTEQVDPAELEQ